MDIYDCLRASKPQHSSDTLQLQAELDAHLVCIKQSSTNSSTNHITNNAANQLQAELDAHVMSTKKQHTVASVAEIDYSIDHWSLQSTQTLPPVTWAPMDKFSSRSAHSTGKIQGHGYVRYDEGMILRPLTITYQQLEHSKRQLS